MALCSKNSTASYTGTGRYTAEAVGGDGFARVRAVVMTLRGRTHGPCLPTGAGIGGWDDPTASASALWGIEGISLVSPSTNLLRGDGDWINQGIMIYGCNCFHFGNS